jgi:hypothetical protein
VRNIESDLIARSERNRRLRIEREKERQTYSQSALEMIKTNDLIEPKIKRQLESIAKIS